MNLYPSSSLYPSGTLYPGVYGDVPSASCTASADAPAVVTGIDLSVPSASADAACDSPLIELSQEFSVPSSSVDAQSDAPTPEVRVSVPSSEATFEEIVDGPGLLPSTNVFPSASIFPDDGARAVVPTVLVEPPSPSVTATGVVPTFTISGSLSVPSAEIVFALQTARPSVTVALSVSSGEASASAPTPVAAIAALVVSLAATASITAPSLQLSFSGAVSTGDARASFNTPTLKIRPTPVIDALVLIEFVSATRFPGRSFGSLATSASGRSTSGTASPGPVRS